MLAATAAGAGSERIIYDTSACSTDAEGKVYVRSHTGVAFAFPMEALTYLRGEIDYAPPPVPNPDDPEGCPGNPIITPGAYLGYVYAPPMDEQSEQPPEPVPLLLKIGGASVRSYSEDGYLRNQGSPIRIAETYRANGFWCEATPAGWEVCYGTMERPEKPTVLGGFYVAREDVHPLRFGAPLTLNCFSPSYPGDSRECSTQYEPIRHVWLSFRFEDDDIPVEDFFILERAITFWLEAARAPELDFEPPLHVLDPRDRPTARP